LFEGRLAAVDGRADRARKRYRRAASIGARLHMPYEQGLAALATALLEPAGSPAREAAARTAVELLDPIDAQYDAIRARALLAERLDPEPGPGPASIPDLRDDPVGVAAE
jgi:hypothetical protein